MNDDVTKYCAKLCEVETLARNYWIDREYPEQDNAEPATVERLNDLRKHVSELEQEHQLLILFARAFRKSTGTADARYGSLDGFQLRRLRNFLDGGPALWQWYYDDEFEAGLASLHAEAAVATDIGRLTSAAPDKLSIPPEFRTRVLTLRKAAAYLGRSNEDSGVDWLNQCMADGTIKAEKYSRQGFVFDRRDFPQEVHPMLTVVPSTPGNSRQVPN